MAVTEVIGFVRDIPTKGQARDLLEERLRSLNQGTQKVRSVLTFRAFALEKWEPAILPTLKRSTQRDYRSLLRCHLLPAFGDKRLSDLTREEVQLFLTEKGKKLAYKTVRHLRVLLSRIFGVAMDWGYLTENIARGCKLSRKGPQSVRPCLTAEDATKLVEKLEGKARIMVVVALLTGLRRGELFALRWKNVDFSLGVTRVREAIYEGTFDSPKTEKSVRDVPMSPTVRAALQTLRATTAYGEPDDLVFCNELGRSLNAQRVLREAVYPACKEAGLPQLGWHAFRHTKATLLHEQGESIKTAQELLGHSDLETTLNIYTHAVPESQRKAVEKLDRILFPSVPSFEAAETVSG